MIECLAYHSSTECQNYTIDDLTSRLLKKLTINMKTATFCEIFNWTVTGMYKLHTDGEPFFEILQFKTFHTKFQGSSLDLVQNVN